MPSLKVWGQDALNEQPSEATAARGWFRSVDEYRGDRGLGAEVLKLDPIKPNEPVPDSLSRRNFLQLLGGGIGVAGLSACFKPPNGKILPYGKSTPNEIPGEPLHYATAYEIDGLATPLLVTCFDGRPTKVEGNPTHPENLGSTGVFEQALLEQLYDPMRLQSFSEKGTSQKATAFWDGLAANLKKLEATKGAGLRLLVNPTSSPLLHGLWAKIRARFPEAKIIEYRHVDLDLSAGTELAIGVRAQPRYEFEQANVVLALDADPLWTVPYGQRIPREIANRRVPEAGKPMSRIYAVEANFSITGMMADHRLRARSAEIGKIALAILHEVYAAHPVPEFTVPAVDVGPDAKFVKAVAKDLLANGGRSAVLVGSRQPAEVQAIGHLLNVLLANVGSTVHYEPLVATGAASGAEELKTLAKDLDQHKVELLIVTAENPVYSAAPELKLGDKIGAVPSVALSYYWDETAKAARWTAPKAHAFESWGDATAPDGSVIVAQPLLAPLFDGVSEAELLSAVAGEVAAIHDQIQQSFAQRPPLHEKFLPVVPRIEAPSDDWSEQLRIGFTKAASLTIGTVNPSANAQAALTKVAGAKADGELSLGLYTSYQLHDGRFGRNGWLQELADPVTKCTWTNVALISAKTAEKLGVKMGELLELTLRDKTIQLPAYILPGHVDNEVSVALGFGQRAALPTGIKPSFFPPDLNKGTTSVTDEVVGVNAYPFRTLDAPWFAGGLKARATGIDRGLALTQEHSTMEGHELALEQPVAALSKGKHLAGELAADENPPSFYNNVKYEGFKWAMAIDLARCSGCNACVVACQSENNTPIVGETQVNRGREMHWLRLDRYFTGENLDEPGAITQPVACVHCEDAPCEYVCPVNATVHSDEGLNEMVYNRCVGTRYCSNNCPYHVRRFNYLNYSYDNKSDTEKMIFNPEVTVRSRGVMEKCTYCVQRIERGRISARVAGREIRDGDIKTACQSACPTQAISFGTLSDPHSKVSEQHEDARAYQLLKDLGTRPRTAHLVRLKNKNPELA